MQVAIFLIACVNGDSEIVTRYKNGGLVIVGKTNASEFGLTATTESLLFGPCLNPWDLMFEFWWFKWMGPQLQLHQVLSL